MDNVFRRYWTPMEERRLFSLVRSQAHVLARRDAAWILLLVKSGFRIGEFSRLNVIDAKEALETGWLFLPREIRKGKKVDHSIPVTKPIEEALAALLRVRREMGAPAGGDQPLVLSRRCERMSIRGYQHKMGVWCFEAGIEGSPHFARHTRAMQIKRESTSKDWRGVVKGALGHATLESGASYTGLSKEDLARELAAIDGPATVRRKDLRRRYEDRRAA